MTYFKAKISDVTEDINVEAKVGNLRVLTSGVVFSPKGENIEIVVDDVTIIFNFLDDEENEKTRINTKVLDDSHVEISLINFNNSSSQGKVVPTNLMFTENFDIHISYMVTTLNKKLNHKQLTYTIYYGERT